MNQESLKRDMLWNAGGNLAYLLAQWLVTVAVTRILDFESAGILSVAMSLSAIFQTVAFFGIRNYQVSDIEQKYEDSAYFAFRHITAISSLLLTFLAALLLGYRAEVLVSILLFMLFRIVESYADVLHGIAQRKGRLDLAGRGFALKAPALLLGFFLGFWLSHTLTGSLTGMLLGSLLSTLLYDLPRVRRLSPFRIAVSPRKALPLAGETFSLCIYFFFLSTVSSAPKFVLEKLVGTETLGAYASIFAPALLIAGVAGYLYTPFIPTFAALAGEKNEKGFRRLTAKILLVLLGFLLVLLVAARFLGEWALVLVFGEGIRAYSSLLYPILVAVFATATLSFFCMLAVVRRRFLPLCLSVGTGAALSAGLAFPLIGRFGANGASYALLIASFAAVLLLCYPVFRKGIHGRNSFGKDTL